MDIQKANKAVNACRRYKETGRDATLSIIAPFFS